MESSINSSAGKMRWVSARVPLAIFMQEATLPPFLSPDDTSIHSILLIFHEILCILIYRRPCGPSMSRIKSSKSVPIYTITKHILNVSAAFGFFVKYYETLSCNAPSSFFIPFIYRINTTIQWPPAKPEVYRLLSSATVQGIESADVLQTNEL